MKLPVGHVPGVGVHKATAYGGFGQQMLEKMGWSKGQGLGKQKDGMKTAIEVTKKEDTLGVGATSSGWKWDWKYWEDAYNTGLKSMEKGSSKKRKRTQSSSSSDTDSDSDSSSSSSSGDDSSSDSDSDSSDDEHDARIAAALNRDGTAASASAAELKLAQQLAKGSKFAGRFGGREGKMARIRHQEEAQAEALRAKLGLQPPTAVAAAAAAAETSTQTAEVQTTAHRKKQKSSANKAAAPAGVSTGEDSSSDTAVQTLGQGKKSSKAKGVGKTSRGKGASNAVTQQEQQHDAGAGKEAVGKVGKHRTVIIIDKQEQSAQAAAAAAFQPTPSSGWWGAKMFTSAGLLEGLEQQQQRPRGFDEDLQTQVYMDAHNAQRQGKKGIGKSSTLKIAGGSWQGKKVTFGEDQEDLAGVEVQASARDQQQQGTKAGVIDSPTDPDLPRQDSSGEAVKTRVQQDPAEGCSIGRSRKIKIKWGALAVQQLQQTPGGEMKWKKLWPLLQKVVEQQQKQQKQQKQKDGKKRCKTEKKKRQDADDVVLAAAVNKDKAWQKLQACKKLQVSGKLVSLSK